MVSRLFGILIFLFAATGAQAQTNPLGAGYSFANGQLFVQISSSLNSLRLPFSISFNVIVPSGTGSFITANPSNSALGGFAVGYQAINGTFFLNALIQPSSQSGGNGCTHSGQMCWRYPPIADGDRHHVCVRWAASPQNSYFYLDGVTRDQTPSATLSSPYTTTADLFWAIGASQPAGSTMYDMRVYAGDIGAAGCSQLAVAAAQGVYPTTGPLSTGMVLHLPMDSTAGPCTNVGAAWTCPDTSGNSNTAVNGGVLPTISIATPAPGPVSSTQNVTVSCTIASGTCSQVCYYLDGYLIGACPTTTSPTYAFSWDTTKAIDGAHVLTAVGFAVSGLTTTSAPVAVTTSNGVSGVVYQFDGVSGSDSNNCVSAPCKTSTKLNSLTYKGGDTIQFNNTTTFTSDSGVPPLICGPHSVAMSDVNGHVLFPGCGQNFFASSTPLTVTKYGGGGACNPLTGSSTTVPTGCARIIGNLSANGLRLYNANNVIVQNLALTGNMGPIGIGIDAGDMPLGGSDSVTVQNNYVFNFGSGGAGIATNPVKSAQFISNKNAGQITNCLIQDNYVTATGVNGSGVGPTSSPDAGITTLFGTTCLVQGNVQENAGGSTSNSQGNGLKSENWPNPAGSTTRNIFQFNVTHNNGGNYTQNVGGPYSLYSLNGDYTTMQFNEEYNQQCWTAPTGFPACNVSTNGPDNGGSDIDEGSTHIIMQYNYIHDNIEQFSNAMLFFNGVQNATWGNPAWGDNYYRYNIVENYFTGMQGGGSGTAGGSRFYNNTLSSNIANSTGSTAGGHTKGVCMQTGSGLNNLCINTAPSGWQFYVFQSVPFCTGIDYNDFYSPTHQDYWASQDGTLWAAVGNINGNITNGGFAAWVTACHAGTHNLNVNPQLAGTPGTGGTCWPGGTVPPAGPIQSPSAANCPSVYQLRTISPLIGAGVAVDSSPTANVTVDFYGNSVPHGTGSGYNIGAYGGTGVP